MPLRPTDALRSEGYAFLNSGLEPTDLSSLRDGIFRSDGPGTRYLLDDSLVRDAAKKLAGRLWSAGILSRTAVAIQAIAFDKTAAVNWKVTWHQDLMFPFARAVSDPGYTLACVKDGVVFARPPVPVLEELLAVRVHLDRCDGDNGPLRVVPGSHRKGVIARANLESAVETKAAVPCLAAEGEALLIKPLLRHASSRAEHPGHRRVLHLVYHDGPPKGELWHRAI
jgi:ectoine hydroxylase-related dioxygenase (phytanoyl-CoA dioxygenase family)